MRLNLPALLKTYSVFGIVIFITLSGCTAKRGRESEPPETQSVIESIKLKEMTGQPIDLNQYRGKTVFINFWATWCKPCIEEMPSIERARAELADKPIEFLFASNEEPERIQGFIKRHNLDLHFILAENMEELNIQALPTTFIINSKGELVFSETGYRKWDEAVNLEMLTKIVNHNE